MTKSITMSRLARRTLNMDESRILAKRRRLSFSLGFLYEEKRVLDNFKIRVRVKKFTIFTSNG